ncbi:MAG: serine protease [Methanoregula sp.]|jgi:hypothetical protein
MFRDACEKNRESIYGIRAFSQVGINRAQNGLGSGFTIAPGIIMTVAHLVHLDNNNLTSPIHSNFEVIRCPDVGQKLETANFIAEDPTHDLALLKINNPRSQKFLTLEETLVPRGTSCGSLGFPLGEIHDTPQGSTLTLIERFQGSSISAYHPDMTPSGKCIDIYEVDSLMYQGSSGCPGFLPNSKVVGMQSRVLLKTKPRIGKKGKKGQTGTIDPNNQYAISIWVPSQVIIKFARENGIVI